MQLCRIDTRQTRNRRNSGARAAPSQGDVKSNEMLDKYTQRDGPSDDNQEKKGEMN